MSEAGPAAALGVDPAMEKHLFCCPRGRSSNRSPVARISQRRIRVRTLQRRIAVVQLLLAADLAPPLARAMVGRQVGGLNPGATKTRTGASSTVRTMVMEHSGDSVQTKTMDEKFRAIDQLGNDHQRHNIWLSSYIFYYWPGMPEATLAYGPWC